MKESKLTRSIQIALQRKGYLVLKIHGGPFQQAGLPDLLVIKKGRAMWLEVKMPGKYATRLQSHWMEKLRKAGCVTAVVCTVSDAIAAVDAMSVVDEK